MWAQDAAPTRMPEDVAIFAVRHGKDLSIDPVVLVYYGEQRFKTVPSLNPPLPSRDRTEADFDKLETSLYKPGTQVSVFSGGEKLGTATVVNSNIVGREGGCVVLSATISYPGPKTPLLASNTASEIPGHASTRRNALPAEVSTLRQLAKQWLIDYGLDGSLVQQGRMVHVVSTELRKGVGRAIVGRFDVTSKKAIFRLLAVAEKDQGRYRLTLTDLEVQRDLEDGTDKAERQYVDQLDIDNDGADEIITSATHYESWSYAVWKFYAKQNGWRRKFAGSGGGC